jgi:hypothetical protein
MNYLKLVSVTAGATLFSSLVLAQATTDIQIDVARQSDEVTYAADGTVKQGKNQAQPPLVTYAAYKVFVENRGLDSTNTVNNVVFRAATRIGAAPVPTTTRVATFAPPAVGDVTCTASATPPTDWGYIVGTTTNTYTPAPNTFIECSIGQLKVGDSKSFTVYFTTPKAPDPFVAETLALDYRLNFGEGSNDSTGASRTDTKQATASIALGTFNPTLLKSAVPPAKQVQLFTGKFGVPIVTGTPSTDDAWATSVVVPSANQKAAKAVINEPPGQLPAFNCFSAFPSCVTSELSIVDDAGQKVLFTIANPLKITLRRDATTIPSGAKIRDAVLQGAVKYFPLIGYDANNNNEPVYGSPVTIFECSRYPLGTAHPETGTNPTVERCIKSYVAYKNSDAPTADYVGDWELNLDATGNGKYSW